MPCKLLARVSFATALTIVIASLAGCDRMTTSVDSESVALGRQLFYDTRLSADGKTSCASCHMPDRAFTDGRAVSIGAFGRTGTRNAPTLIGLAEYKRFFWDGRNSSLEDAVLQPLINPSEMGNTSFEPVLEAISGASEYTARLGNTISEADLAKPLVAYLKSLATSTPRSATQLPIQASSKLSHDISVGLQLFRGKAQCSSCHHFDERDHSLTDNEFHHASVGFERIAGNVRATQDRLEATKEAGTPVATIILNDSEISELGRFAVSSKPRDLGAFRTPSLKNVANTAPYMHDGSIDTLEDAIHHELYYRGLANGQPIELTIEEQQQLAAFLRSLSLR
jgi:cytochrome c peroxidase